MTGKEILDVNVIDEGAGFKESIRDYIRDLIDQALCEEVYDKIVEERKLSEDGAQYYDFYGDPIWADAWNKKIDEMVAELKL